MAFGGLRTTFKNSATSIGTSIVASGTQAVRLGDLIFVVGGEQTALTITGVTDNLGNSYTSCNNTVNTTGAITGRAFWARAKDDGTLTTVTIACNGGTNNGVIVVAIIEGAITNAIDADPANAITDIASPFVCPTTGTLGQANEIVIGFLVGSGSTVNTATSPNLLADQQATAAILHATIGYQAVTVTTAVTPTFAAGSNPANQLMGVASFRRDDTPLGAGKRLGMQWLPTPRDVRHPQALVTWVKGRNIPLNDPAPFTPEIWPNPIAAARPAGLTWTNPAIQADVVVTTYLPSVTNWGPPPPDVRHPNILQTWANELNLPLNVAPVAPEAPFSKTDWPLPQGFATKGGAWINPALQAVVVPPDTTNLPSTTSGWSVPPALPPTFSFVQRGNALGTVAVPFNKTSWPNPRAAKRANALLTWSNGLPPLQFVLRAPLIARHNEQSWHVALKPQFVNLLPFAPPPVVDTTVYLPSVTTSWTIPASLPPLNQSFTRPLSLPLNVVVAAAPFNKTDWPNPKAAQQALSFARSLNLPLNTVVSLPFGKSDWTVPGRSPPTQSFTLSYNLPLNTPAGPAPFNQLSWPNPREPQRNAVHRAWVYSAPPVPDLNVYLPSAVSAWLVPRGLRPLHLQILIGNSQICLNPPEVVVPPEPDFPPHPPPTDSGGAGVKSGVWKPGQQGKRPNYRSYRFITEKEIEQLTGREIRQSARDLRADVRKDPLAEEIAKEIAALARIVDYLADADRLEASVAELSRAIEYARRARAEAEADDEEVSFLLLS